MFMCRSTGRWLSRSRHGVRRDDVVESSADRMNVEMNLLESPGARRTLEVIA